jgi:AI-2 transport protein TqsA
MEVRMTDAVGSRSDSAQTVFLGVIAMILSIYVMKNVSDIILPIVVALLLARLSDPVISWFRKRKLPVGLAIVAVLIGAALLISSIAVIITICAQQLTAALPHYADKANLLLANIAGSLKGLLGGLGFDAADLDLSHSIQPAQIIGILTAGFGSALTFISTALLILFLMLMIIAGEDVMFKGMEKGYGKERHDRAVAFLATVDGKVQKFLFSKTLVNLITATLTFVILTVFGLDLAFVFAVLTFFFSYIPAIGGIVSLLLPIILATLQFDDSGTIIGMAVTLLVVNVLIDRLVEPKLLGQSLDLSPLIVFLSFILFTWMWGTIGAIIAVPITAIIKAAFETSPKLRPIALMMGN